jgi:predicted nicotinamide N-methyase
MEHYWSVQQSFCSQLKVLDPFGLVSWPGAVVAARAMLTYKEEIQNSKVLVLGADPGVEAQALAMLGAKQVIASDIHPTTLQVLRYGAQQSGLDGIIQGQGVFYNAF